MNINTKMFLKDLQGNHLKVGGGELTVGQALANIILADSSIPDTSLADTFLSADSVDVSATDIETLKTAIDTNVYANLVNTQLLKILEG